MKRLGLLGLFIVGGVLAAGAIAWSQATRLPQWYTAHQVDKPNNAEATQQSAQQVTQKLKTLRNPETTVTLDQQEINDVMTAAIESVGRKASIAQAIKGVNTELDNGQLKAGAVIDFSQIQSGEFSRTENMILAEALKRMPGLGNREVYVGIESTPKIQNGQVQLDPSTRVKIGALSLSLQDVANYVGVTPIQLQAEINKALPIALLDLPVEAIDVTDKNLTIRSAQPK